MEALPELSGGLLDAPTLSTLFDDLERLAHVLEVRVKAGARTYAGEEAVNLRAAQAALSAGETRGVQIRYRWSGDLWCDTLLSTPSGVRLVRMREG